MWRSMLFLARRGQILTQGGSLYDITVGTVVNVDIHRMMLLHLHTAGDTGQSPVSHADIKTVEKTNARGHSLVVKMTFAQICVDAG